MAGINMNNTIKKRTGYMTDEQKRLLIEFMSNHKQLVRCKLSPTFTAKDAQRLWEEITEILNSSSGGNKTWQQRRKSWQDIRAKTKSKNSLMVTERKGTGDGPQNTNTLTGNEEVIQIFGQTIIEGHQNAEESVVEFCWESEGDNEEANPELMPGESGAVVETSNESG